MDPVSHLVMGRALVASLERTTGARFGPGVSAAALIGALAPDIDSVLMPAGWDIYLRAHQSGTHSLLGACLLGGSIGVLIDRGVRFAPRRRALSDQRALASVSSAAGDGARGLGAGRPPQWSGLALAATLAALSHLLLDVLSGAPLRLLWPFAARRFTVPLVAMAEPWLVALFVAGATAMWWTRPRLRRSAIGVLLVAALLFGVKFVLYGRMLEAIAGDARLDAAAPRAIEARWGDWLDWHVFERDRDALHVWRANAASRSLTPVLSWPLTPESPWVTASRSFDTVRNFTAVHALTFSVERRQEHGQREVLWSDVRYCWIDRAPDIQCALWFGGVFDGDGTPLRQVVHLGAWIQARPPSR